MHVIFIFIFCQWLVCCLTGFYQPNRDDDDDDDDDDEFSFCFCVSLKIFEIGSRISSLGRALDCRAVGRGFDSQDRTNTRGFKITEK